MLVIIFLLSFGDGAEEILRWDIYGKYVLYQNQAIFDGLILYLVWCFNDILYDMSLIFN